MTIEDAEALSNIELDHRALKIDREHRLIEPVTVGTRWWDYRLEHPTLSTYRYAYAYLEAHRNWWRQYIDCDRADEQTLWKGDLFNSRDIVSFWLARQFADRLGMPYSFVLEFASARAYGQQMRCIPRPNQLYTEEFEIDLQAAWTSDLETRFRLPTIQYYKVENYCHSRAQDEFRAWLILRIHTRQHPRHRLIARLLSEGWISPAMVEAEWGSEVLGQACVYAESLRFPAQS